MGAINTALYAFNRGLVSQLALARTDVKRLAFSAETMTNWMPRVMGSMMLRPGTEYIGASDSNNYANYLEFIFSSTDTAIIELTASLMRVWVSDALVTRASVSSAITNGNFTSDITSWTNADESGATSAWATGGYLSLVGTGTNAAIERQLVTVISADQGVEHALRIHIGGETTYGDGSPVTLKVGSTAGGDEYIGNTALDPGYHSLTFTPTGDFYIEFQNRSIVTAYVESVSVESPGTMTLPAPWAEADLENIRFSQSGDILFVACSGYQQYKIERRSTTSWSVVKYYADDGPFLTINISGITLTPTTLSGGTVTASGNFFKSTHVGALLRLVSDGQTVSSSISGENTFTNTIEVEGVGSQRAFAITRSGTWSATITLQRSLTSSTGPWEDVTTYTTNATVSYNDTLDNQIAWYRIGIKTGDYTSGTVTLTLDYPIGSITGILRIISYTSATSVGTVALQQLGSTDAHSNWYEGAWSSYRGFPTAVTFHEGRLWWFGQNKTWGSVSDAYYSYDDTVVGDSGPIERTIAIGPVDSVNWALSLERLLFGTDGVEFVCKASSLDEPLTPTAFAMRRASSQGSKSVEAVAIDKTGIYVQRGGGRVMEIAQGINPQTGYLTEYSSKDLTILYPEAGSSPIVKLGIQRQPDTRLHCIRTDGTVAILIFDPLENVACWCYYQTDGIVEDVVILPGADGSQEDAVYYAVKRTINGSTVRYLEKWSLESECQGGTLNKQADAFYHYSGINTTRITSLGHLEAESVVVWGNGKYLGTYTVSGAQITLPEAVTECIVGKSYTAQWKSSKLAYGAQMGTALAQKKRIHHLGLILRNTHYEGLQYGPDFAFLDDLAQVIDGAVVAADTIHAELDDEMVEFPGEWDTDSRLCLQATAPKPCTCLAVVVGMETHEKH